MAQRAGGDTEWAKYGLDNSETHYSPIQQANASNVNQLGLVWAADLGSFAGQIEGTPLVVDGTLHETLPWSVTSRLTSAREK